MVPVAVENGAIHHEGRRTGLESQGVRSGAARLFVRPYDLEIVAPEIAPFSGTVRRVHGLGPARRIEVALGADVIEVDVPRARALDAGQRIGLAPQRYRVFAAAS